MQPMQVFNGEGQALVNINMFAQVYYREGTEKQPNDARRIGVAAAWLERAMNILKPVTLPDGTQIPRVIEPWVPKKKIKAVNPK